LSSEPRLAAIERIPGTTFLPFSTAEATQLHKLNMRNMIPNPNFHNAIQNVPADGNPSSAEAVMGPYYPQAAFCSLATLAHTGPNACLVGNE
jgi:hypothetical protein